jgi:hypothetical protein
MLVDMKNYLISNIFDKYISSLLIIAKLITGAFIQLKMIVPDMSVMYTLYGKDLFNNEHDLVYFRLNYVAGRGLCIACNSTLRMLVVNKKLSIVFACIPFYSRNYGGEHLEVWFIVLVRHF